MRIDTHTQRERERERERDGENFYSRFYPVFLKEGACHVPPRLYNLGVPIKMFESKKTKSEDDDDDDALFLFPPSLKKQPLLKCSEHARERRRGSLGKKMNAIPNAAVPSSSARVSSSHSSSTSSSSSRKNVALHHQKLSSSSSSSRLDTSFFLPTAINNKYGQTIRAITEECDDGFAAPGICSTASKREYRRKIRTDAFSGSSNNNVRVADASPLDKMEELLGAIWKFVRPHTIRGTLLGTTALVSKVLIENPELIQLSLFPRALLGLFALLCGNGFIVGINQIYDVEIDKVNKPYLPIAAGELSLPMAWAFCLATAIGGATIVAMNFGPLITSLYTFGLFLGTIYSVPPLRLKRYALPAFMIIATVRGFLLNFGVFHATRAALHLPFVWSPPVLFITIFVTVFATAIAVTKDLADIDGDKQFGIETFTTKMGVKNVSYIGSGLLLMNYVFAIGLSLFNPTWFKQKIMITMHAILATYLIAKTKKLEKAGFSQSAVQTYYQDVWKLFYSEYLLLPFI